MTSEEVRHVEAPDAEHCSCVPMCLHDGRVATAPTEAEALVAALEAAP